MDACFSFYPLYPSPEDVNIDYEEFELYARMPCTPHVLVVPSDLKQFTKVAFPTDFIVQKRF